jgi:hypothetical protein
MKYRLYIEGYLFEVAFLVIYSLVSITHKIKFSPFERELPIGRDSRCEVDLEKRTVSDWLDSFVYFSHLRRKVKASRLE